MDRFKCPACGGNQYTACDTAEGCIYCGNKELKKMEILEPKEGKGMREIKFRGKRLDDGEWVYGSLLMSEPQEKSLEPLHCFIFPLDKGCHRVIPDTVGQFTGLHDKNGKEIYEGDIVKLCDTNPILFRVEIILARYGYKTVFKLLDDGTIAQCYFLDKCEVVGNIHDNPKLLKEGSV